MFVTEVEDEEEEEQLEIPQIRASQGSNQIFWKKKAQGRHARFGSEKS